MSTTIPPARAGATVTVMAVPAFSISIDRLRVQPLAMSCAGLGSSSPLQCPAWSLSSLMSK